MAELSAADRALLTEAQERARARMSGRTIDETGRDISEQPQLEPELIRTGWYWTGTETVWVFGPNWGNTGVYYQATGGTAWAVTNWCTARKAKDRQRVHERVQESGQGFGWRPPAPNH